eukprot:2833355-Prymnesium_polylepis.1
MGVQMYAVLSREERAGGGGKDGRGSVAAAGGGGGSMARMLRQSRAKVEAQLGVSQAQLQDALGAQQVYERALARLHQSLGVLPVLRNSAEATIHQVWARTH